MLISTLEISLYLGINGIAYTNIIVNLLLFIASLILLNKNIEIFNKTKLDFSWIKTLIHIGGISGLESFIRNFFFLAMIIKMVNAIGEQETFWIANSFIWGWLLLPILQLGELVKCDCAENKSDIVKQITGKKHSIKIIVVMNMKIYFTKWIIIKMITTRK